MAEETLVADLAAMGRLLPQVQDLAGEVRQGLPSSISVTGTVAEGVVPSLAAAQSMATGTTPFIRSVVAARFVKIAEMIEIARRGFVTTDEQLLTVVNAIPTLQPQRP
ncbi:hypothetical protein ACXPWS_07095 [Mycobacterium sp. BMJ-28]